MTITPTTPEGLRKHDDLDAARAVLAAWNDAGSNPAWHERSRREVRAAMPLLGRALDRLGS